MTAAVGEPDVRLSAEEFETRVEQVAGRIVADRVRVLDRWLEDHDAHLDAFVKTTMVSMFPWWAYPVPRSRLPVIWPIAVRIEQAPAERVMIRVVFQELKFRPPFDDVAVRQELLDRMVLAGLDARANLAGRPGLDVGHLDARGADALLGALDWFLTTAHLH